MRGRGWLTRGYIDEESKSQSCSMERGKNEQEVHIENISIGIYRGKTLVKVPSGTLKKKTPNNPTQPTTLVKHPNKTNKKNQPN